MSSSPESRQRVKKMVRLALRESKTTMGRVERKNSNGFVKEEREGSACLASEL